MDFDEGVDGAELRDETGFVAGRNHYGVASLVAQLYAVEWQGRGTLPSACVRNLGYVVYVYFLAKQYAFHCECVTAYGVVGACV